MTSEHLKLEMIPIKNSNLSNFSIEHSESVIGYFQRKKSKSLIIIDQWIKKIWGSTYSFEKILRMDQNDLSKIITHYNSTDHKIPEEIKKIKKVYKNFSVVNSSPFKQKNGQPYNAYILIDKIGINVCPYCNRNYIYNIPASKNRTSQLDHFYNKDKYPFLSLAFYNLIPCCPSCNHLKSNSIENFHSPYDYSKKENELFQFSVKILGSEYLDKTEHLSLELKSIKDFKSNINIFKLKQLYSKHLDLVQELLIKKHIYSEGYIKQLFNEYGGKIFKNSDDLLLFILSNYILEEDLHKRPFSKLTKDIWNQILTA